MEDNINSRICVSNVFLNKLRKGKVKKHQPSVSKGLKTLMFVVTLHYLHAYTCNLILEQELVNSEIKKQLGNLIEDLKIV